MKTHLKNCLLKTNQQQKEINKLTDTLNQLINATTNSFNTVMNE